MTANPFSPTNRRGRRTALVGGVAVVVLVVGVVAAVVGVPGLESHRERPAAAPVTTPGPAPDATVPVPPVAPSGDAEPAGGTAVPPDTTVPGSPPLSFPAFPPGPPLPPGTPPLPCPPVLIQNGQCVLPGWD